jgi:4-coumarate--CoA ligase (photoactive yellow protein activation family)
MFHLSETGVDEYLLRYRKLSDWAEIVSVSLKKKAEWITFRTSGSSGKPKPCRHRVADLEQEVSLHADSYRELRRVVTLVPRHHIYGFLWTTMLAAQVGIEVVDARWWTSPKLADEIRPGDLLVGTPSIWPRLSEGGKKFPSSVKAVTSGAPCPEAIFRELQAQGLAVSEIYGTSETGGIGRRESAGQPFELLSFWSRSNISDALSRQSDQSGDRREFEVPDWVEWLDERRFAVGGRKDEAVQVLGTNVYPGRVADLILSHPGVKECAVRLMRAEEGARLKAFVVPRSAGVSPVDSDQLSTWLRGQLQPHERPGSIIVGTELPRGETGKLADWAC